MKYSRMIFPAMLRYGAHIPPCIIIGAAMKYSIIFPAMLRYGARILIS